MSLRRSLSLYLVLDPGLCAGMGMAETTRRAVLGGVSMVQLRVKQASTAEAVAHLRDIKSVLAGTGVPLIMNDNVEAALEGGADGVHVGQGDMPVAQVRERIGPDLILGLSAETPDHAAAADPALVDYLGAGPVFATATKPGHAPPCGLEGLPAIIAASSLPSVAIGGIKAQHAAQVFASGADGLAVVSAICGQPDPEAAAQSLAQAIAFARQSQQEPSL
ncbi:MAG: thiamine phosphate synthase [Mangrovicoccus sp.]